jgi:small subunit ribosomal protein S6
MATEIRNNKYEAMFVFPQSYASDLNGAMDHIKEVMSKGSADVTSMVKWDERRLAYDIKGNKRGVYFLARFRCDASKVKEIERDCRLSEKLLRTLITRNDELTDEQMTNAEAAQKTADEARLRSMEEEDTGARAEA